MLADTASESRGKALDTWHGPLRSAHTHAVLQMGAAVNKQPAILTILAPAYVAYRAGRPTGMPIGPGNSDNYWGTDRTGGPASHWRHSPDAGRYFDVTLRIDVVESPDNEMQGIQGSLRRHRTTSSLLAV